MRTGLSLICNSTKYATNKRNKAKIIAKFVKKFTFSYFFFVNK